MKHLAARGSKIRPVTPRPQHWAPFSIGRTGFRLDAMALVRDRGTAVNLVLTDEMAKPHFYLLDQERAAIEAKIGMTLHAGDRLAVTVTAGLQASPLGDRAARTRIGAACVCWERAFEVVVQ